MHVRDLLREEEAEGGPRRALSAGGAPRESGEGAVEELSELPWPGAAHIEPIAAEADRDGRTRIRHPEDGADDVPDEGVEEGDIDLDDRLLERHRECDAACAGMPRQLIQILLHRWSDIRCSRLQRFGRDAQSHRDEVVLDEVHDPLGLAPQQLEKLLALLGGHLRFVDEHRHEPPESRQR